MRELSDRIKDLTSNQAVQSLSRLFDTHLQVPAPLTDAEFVFRLTRLLERTFDAFGPMASEFNWDSDPEEGDGVRTEVADDHDEDVDPTPRISEIRRFRDVIYDYSKLVYFFVKTCILSFTCIVDHAVSL